jgi:hypothetical protein
MTKIKYRDINFKAASRVRIGQLQTILRDYPQQRLTARQVYYQFVARGLLENNQRNYKNLTGLLTDARYAGLVSWDMIEDRGRTPDTPPEWDSIGERVEGALNSFRLPRWEGQENYVEVWVEKQALAGVLEPITWEFHVTLMVNKGYSSASAMKESADRIRARVVGQRPTRTPWVLYLGDHDPSGEDMVRDVRDRLMEFGVPRLEVRKVALTWDQIQQHNPPPNPAKLTDSRARAYIERYGEESWELDALPPNELNRLVEDAILQLLDREMMDQIIAREVTQKTKLKKALAKIE